MNEGKFVPDDGWEQVRAGIELVCWSRLATFDRAKLCFESVFENDFESGHHTVHDEYGRLISWMSFSAGAEYLIKGALAASGVKIARLIKVTRAPIWTREPIAQWSAKVVDEDPDIRVPSVSYGTLGQLPLEKLALLPEALVEVQAAYRYLAIAIRNRDAHRFEQNVRADHFIAVPQVFLPAFNAVLSTLDREALERAV